MSRDAGRCRCGARAVAAALHGEEPGDPGAMNAAEPVRGASPHRVPDEKDGNVRQLRMLTLRAEVGECPKQRFIARRVVDQGGRSNERHVSAGELRVRDSLPPLSRPENTRYCILRPRCHVTSARESRSLPVAGSLRPGRKTIAALYSAIPVGRYATAFPYVKSWPPSTWVGGDGRRGRRGRHGRPGRYAARLAPSARDHEQREQRDRRFHVRRV